MKVINKMPSLVRQVITLVLGLGMWTSPQARADLGPINPTTVQPRLVIGEVPTPAPAQEVVLTLGEQPPLPPEVPPPGEAHPEPPPVQEVAMKVEIPANSDGLSLLVKWTAVPGSEGYTLLRALEQAGPYTVVADDLPPAATEVKDTLSTDASISPPPPRVFYRLAFKGAYTQPLRVAADLATAGVVTAGGEATAEQKAAQIAAQEAYVSGLLLSATPPVEGVPQDSWFHQSRWPVLVLIVIMAALILFFTRQARLGREIYIRRIPGVDAIEEAVGRATEMGKPILYVPGVGEFQEIQTIASLLILGRVAEIVANYESDIIVPCTYPIVREVADEAVRQGYYQAGRADAYKAANVRFISSEQFAFTAGTNGIILREKPAANIYLGQFFAESLIFAETGFINQSIQIAGTAETTQIPFFVTACDYTLIGEELYAVSAYLTREPRLTSSLKASDWIRIGAIVLLLLGTTLLLFDITWLRDAMLMDG